MQLQKLLFIISISLLSFYSKGQPRNYIKQSREKQAAQVFRFFIEQELKVKKIKSEFPDLSNDINDALRQFNSSFGTAKRETIKYLTEVLGSNDYNTYERETIKIIAADNNSLTKEQAIEYIKEIQNRSFGKISSPTLEYILSFQSLDYPADEFTDGYTYNYSTESNPDANNLNISFKIPKSWAPMEIDRRIVKEKFQSECGNGLQIIMLTTNKFQAEDAPALSQKDLEKQFSEKEMKKLVPNNAKYISSSQINIDGKIGGMLIIEQVAKRLDFFGKIRMVQFYFVSNNNIVALQCMVLSSDTTSNLEPLQNKFIPLFKLVTNSIVDNTTRVENKIPKTVVVNPFITKTIPLVDNGSGTYTVPCNLNGLKMNFIFDTGASLVSISETEASFMLKNGYLKTSDVIGSEYYKIANGEIEEGTKILIREIEFAGIKIYNVEASIVHNSNAPLLLGQSVISKLGKIQIDYEKNTLTIIK